MNRKIILACLILAVAVATIGVASALSTQINLPDGYEIDEAQSYSNNTTFMGVDCECNHAVMVNGDKNITVDTYLPRAEFELTPSNGSVMKNISGKEGIYSEIDGRHIFIYSDNHQGVQINAPDANVIEEIIGK